MLQITDRAKENALDPIWRMPFRPLFLAAAIWSCVALILWLMTLMGNGTAVFRIDVAWHAHEMLFGFAGAVIVGFVCTACQTWTGLRAPTGRALVLLSSCWLLARLGYLFWAVPLWFPVAAEVAFFAGAAFMLGRRVIAVRQWHNLFLIPALLTFAGLSAWHALSSGATRPVALLTLLLVASMVLVFGGRVIPFFTARRFGLTPRAKLPWLEWSGHGLCIALLLSMALSLPREWTGVVALLLGLVQLVRCARWPIGKIFSEPMLWSLHISFWLIVAGVLLLGAVWLGLGDPAAGTPLFSPFFLESGAVHLIGVGGIGGIILSMISRVTLGHTGRSPLNPPRGIALAFAALLAASLVRVLLAPAPIAYWLSVTLWLCGYGLFLWRFAPMLLAPRTDGQPG
ncbi:NnrS family protein [Microbulbifer hainanensis]|uniref:NnrS family protein n=1 Tax=Microbulbifer hainanensis TaxID=2735675 RepID=UPI001866263D|nr:NnrS family protein [Microbulbifer hainanensis]